VDQSVSEIKAWSIGKNLFCQEVKFRKDQKAIEGSYEMEERESEEGESGREARRWERGDTINEGPLWSGCAFGESGDRWMRD
jgi:hypothetical protein